MDNARTIDQPQTSGARRTKVACVGVYIIDILGRPVEIVPGPQRSHLLEQIRVTVAGTCGGTSIDLARLGAEVRAVGAIGEDELGDLLVMLVERNGISAKHLVRKSGVQTSATMLPITPSGERPGWHVIGANGELCREDVPREVIADCDFLHLGGLSGMPKFDGDPSVELLQFAKARGIVTTVDCLGAKRADLFDMLKSYLPHVDYFMPNEEEVARITGRERPLDGALALQALGGNCVIVKMGARGCLIVDDERRLRLPAFEVPVVDSTGCGDAFCAGTIVGLGMGWDIERAARLGTAAAGLTITGLGSDAGIRSLAATLDFMRTATPKDIVD